MVINPYFLRPTPIPYGSLVNNDFSGSSWTYSGTGSMVNNVGDIVFSGGTNSLSSIARYTALPSGLKQCTMTCRFVMTGVDASNGVIGIGLQSRRTSSLKHFCLLNARTGASKGNLLMFYDAAFDSETQPTVIPFTNGDTIELVMDLTLLTATFKAKNITQASSYITLTKNMSITYSVGAQDLHEIYDLLVVNYSGTNTMNYFDYSTNEYKFADLWCLGTSKVHGFYAASQANRASDLWSTATNKKIVNVGAQSCALEHFVLLNPLMSLMKPKKIFMMDPVRNNISAGTFDNTAKANFQSIVTSAQSLGADVWYQLALPEAVLNQSSGDTYINSVAPANRIQSAPAGWAHATHTSDGTHPNVLGNSLWASNMQLYSM